MSTKTAKSARDIIRGMASSRKELYYIDPATIYVDDNWNARNLGTPESKAHIEELAESIADVGVRKPLTLKWNPDDERLELRDGFCRMAAIRLAEEKHGAKVEAVPCMIEDRHLNEADSIASMITGNDGLKLSTIEQAEVVRRLLNFGLDEKAIKQKIGKSATHVSNLVLLCSAHPETAKLVKDGKVATSIVLDELKRGSPEKAKEKVQGMVNKVSASGQRATRKNTKAPAPKTFPWAKHGPVLFKHLRAICNKYDELESVPDELADLIVEAKRDVAVAIEGAR